MALTARDQAFRAFCDRFAALLRRTALLLVGEPARAERLASSVLARRYPALEPPETLLVSALRELVRPQPALFRPPWAREPRLELVDGSSGARTSPLLAELQRLPVAQRAALVLTHDGGLEPATVAAVLGLDAASVAELTRQAERTLGAVRPEWRHPGRLAEELRSAAAGPPSGDPRDTAAGDLQHGRQLARRRRTRHAAALVAAVLVVVVGAVAVVRSGATVPQAASSPAPTSVPSATSSSSPTRVSALCDIHNPSCQATVMRDWRGEISRVAASYLDPEGRYFTGYSFSYDPRYETPSFWKGQGGALGLEMFRIDRGATEVYVQVASDYGSAIRCGRMTGHTCESQRFMDGNRFSLSTSTQVEQGIEVQHRPDGDQVVTVVARNTTRGQVLHVTRADLIALVQDPRLRLPEI
jgi:DNA-directed RNA polymerase specialized sigma24 family protein